MGKLLASSLFVISLVACATPQRATFSPLPFNEAEFALLQKKGTGSATVSGQVFMKTRGGDVKKGAGESVLLAPVTENTRQIMAETEAGRRAMPPLDMRYAQYFVEAMSDAEGRFRFDNVPAGDYFVASHVSWEAQTQFGIARQGGSIVKTVTVRDGKTAEVMLTR